MPAPSSIVHRPSSPIIAMKTPTLLLLLAVLLSACDFGGSAPSGTATATEAAPQSAEGQRTAEAGLETVLPSLQPCLAEDLKAVAGYQGATGSMAGGVSFTNVSATSCALEGRPGIHVTDAKGNLMPVANLPFFTEVENGPEQTATPSNPLVLRPSETAFAYFVWSNWCGQAEGPFTLAVALPGEGGQINVPALDPGGKPLSMTPRCDQADATSTISIKSFEHH